MSYVIGKGKLFFDKYPDGASIDDTTVGEGELFFGNCPSFTVNNTPEVLEHMSSTGGIKEVDYSTQTGVTRSVSFTCDNINADNIAKLFLGEASDLVQASAVGAVTNIAVAKRGRYYQLGATPSNPGGVRNVSNVVVSDTVPTTITQAGNYTVDLTLGRIYIEANAPDINDIEINVTYDVAAETRSTVVSGNKVIHGALRFVADNPEGENRDYYYPFVQLSPDGAFDLIGDDWQTISYTASVNKKGTSNQVYIDGRAA